MSWFTCDSHMIHIMIHKLSVIITITSLKQPFSEIIHISQRVGKLYALCKLITLFKNKNCYKFKF